MVVGLTLESVIIIYKCNGWPVEWHVQHKTWLYMHIVLGIVAPTLNSTAQFWNFMHNIRWFACLMECIWFQAKHETKVQKCESKVICLSCRFLLYLFENQKILFLFWWTKDIPFSFFTRSKITNLISVLIDKGQWKWYSQQTEYRQTSSSRKKSM